MDPSKQRHQIPQAPPVGFPQLPTQQQQQFLPFHPVQHGGQVPAQTSAAVVTPMTAPLLAGMSHSLLMPGVTAGPSLFAPNPSVPTSLFTRVPTGALTQPPLSAPAASIVQPVQPTPSAPVTIIETLVSNPPQQSSKTNVSRHVASVISHFTSNTDGFDRLLNELDDFLHVVHKHGILAYSSPSVKRYLDFDNAELSDRKLEFIVHPDDYASLMQHIHSTLASKNDFFAYCRYKKKNGEYVLLEVKGKPYYGKLNDGRDAVPEHVICSAREYTSKATESVDAILELRIENLRLRRQLEQLLLKKGTDPLGHPLLNDASQIGLGTAIVNAATGQPSLPVAVASKAAIQQAEGFLMNDLSQSSNVNILDNSDSLNLLMPESAIVSKSLPKKNGKSTGASSTNTGASSSHNVDRAGPTIVTQGTSSRRVSSTADQVSPVATSAGGPVNEKKRRIPQEELFCRQCGTTASPEWRKGPEGPKTLCNACGLAYSKKQRKLSQAPAEGSKKAKVKNTPAKAKKQATTQPRKYTKRQQPQQQPEQQGGQSQVLQPPGHSAGHPSHPFPTGITSAMANAIASTMVNTTSTAALVAPILPLDYGIMETTTSSDNDTEETGSSRSRSVSVSGSASASGSGSSAGW